MRHAYMMLAVIASASAAQTLSTPYDAARSSAETPGQWRYLAQASGGEAQFGARFQIRCERATRRLLLRRIDPVLRAPLGPLTISTDTMTRAIAGDGWLAWSDPLLSAIAFSRGRFVVDGGGGERLILPTAPEAARSIEDCRN